MAGHHLQYIVSIVAQERTERVEDHVGNGVARLGDVIYEPLGCSQSFGPNVSTIQAELGNAVLLCPQENWGHNGSQRVVRDQQNQN